jgi:TP901 family phage tail tape measure protein
MADVESNIHVNIDTSDALASLKLLQRQISAFHTQMAKSGTAAAAVAANQAQNLMNSINATGQFQASMRSVTSSTESFTDALERNKLTSREYFRYTGAATKTFGRLFKSEFETLNKVARERVKDIQTQYIKMGRGANGALQAIAVRPLTLDMKNLGTQTAIAAQRQQLLNQLLKQGSTNLLNFGKNTQWAGRQLMVGFTVPLAMLGTTASKTFMKLEEQAIRFKRVYGELFTTKEETDVMVKNIQLLAKEYTKYGVAVEDTMKMAADAAAMGKMGADLIAQVAQATRLAVLGGVEQSAALETTISVTNAFGVATDQLANKINFLNAVENQTVVSIEDLTIAMPKAGPVVKQLGGDVEDLAFFLTAMKEGGINASEGANALKSGLASLINPSDKASKMLNGLGVNIKGIVEANKGDVKNTVIGFAQALDTLDPLNRARAIEQLFGKFQFSRLSTLFQNVIGEGTQASRVLKLANATTEELAILSERELSKIQNTTTYKFKKSMEDLKVAIAPVGEQFLKALTPIVEFVGKILDKFNNLGDGSKKFLTILTVAVAGVGPVLLMSFGLIANAVANIIKMFAGLKSMYNRTGSSSKVLGEQTNYLTKEQLEASAVAASLDQVHTKLQQTFTSETTAVNMLANAYKRAIAAQMGFTGPPAGKRMPKLKYSDGTTRVPGTGNKDTIPSVLTPGEAVIPAKAAQDPANRPFIAHMVAGGTVQGFNTGTTDAQPVKMSETHVGGKSEPRLISDILKAHPEMSENQRLKLITMQQVLLSQGLPAVTTVKHGLMFDFPLEINKKMYGEGITKQAFIDEWVKTGASKWHPSGMSPVQAQVLDDVMLQLVKESKSAMINDDLLKNIYETEVPKRISPNDPGYIKSRQLYAADVRFNMGQGLGTTPETSKAILEKAATTIDPATGKPYIAGYEIKTRFSESQGKIVTSSGTVTLHPGIYDGFEIKEPTTVNMNRLGSGTTPKFSQGSKSKAKTKLSVPLKAPELIDLEKAMEHKEKLRAVAIEASQTEYGAKKPTDFGKQQTQSSGRSNFMSTIGGVFTKPDGTKVFVKPMLSELDAIAEKRATEIARKAHGLISPKQTIRTMIDPTDIDEPDVKKKRKIIVLESPFDPRFDPNTMPKTFTERDYIKQLVASSLRADKDLKRGNLGGNVIADVGAAGVFDSASGTRSYSAGLPSMESIAMHNLKGVPGPNAYNSPFWFGNATADIPQSIQSAEDYERKIKDEIHRTLPKLRKTIDGFKLADGDPAKKVYEDMYRRLESGLNEDWKKVYNHHRAILIKPDELIENTKTGELRKPKTTQKPQGVSSSSGKPADTRKAPALKENERVVQKPKPRRGPKGTILPGYADAPQARSSVSAAMVDGARGSLAEAKAVGANIGTTLSQSAAAASRTALYGGGSIDADAKSLRRQMEKRQREEARTQAKMAASKTKLYGTGPMDADAKSMRRQMEKRTKLANSVAYQKRIISERAAAQFTPAPSVSSTPIGPVMANGKFETSKLNRLKKNAKTKMASGKVGSSMGGAMGVASGVAMIGSMAPGKVGEISQKIMMPLMGMAMIMPMLQNKFSALAVGVGLVVAAYAYQRMVFDKAQDAAMELTDAMGSGTRAIKALSEFSTKVGAGEIMSKRRKDSFSPFQIKTGKTTFGESYMAGEGGKAMAKNVTQTIKMSGKDVAMDQVANQLQTAVVSGALSADQARSIAANLGKELGDYSFGIEVNSKLISILGPNGENILDKGVDLEVRLLQDTRSKMNLSTDAARKAGGWTGKDVAKTGGYSIGGAAAGAGAGFVAAGLGAAGAAAVGATVGSAVPVVGTIIGAALGAGVGYFLAKKDRNKRIGEASGASIAMQKIALQQQQELNDSVELQYQKELAIAEAAGDTAKIKELTDQFEKDQVRLLTENAALVTDIQNSYANSDGATKSALMTGADKAVTKQYKGTALEDVVPLAQTQINDSGISKEMQYTLKMQMASGQIDPMQMIEIFDTFGKDKASVESVVTIIGKFGGAFANQMMGIVGMFKDKKQAAKFVADIKTKSPKEAQKQLELFQRISQSATVVDKDILLNYYNKNPKAAQDIQDALTKIDALKGKVSLTVAATVLGAKEMEALKADQEYFDKLPPEQQKVYLQNMKVMMSMEGDPAMQVAYKNWLGEKGNTGKTFSEYVTAKTQTVTETSADTSKTPTATPTGDGSKVQSSPLDDLVKKLRDVRKNQIKVTEGWSASRKALESLFGGKKTIDVFSGIENDIRKLGGSQDFIEMIVGMDPKEYEKRKKSLFTFDNKGNIVGLKRDAKNIQEAMNSIAMGDWNSSMEAESKALSDQGKAFDRIAALGVPVANAYDLITDKTIAQAIANGVNDKTLKSLIAKYKGLTAAQEKSAAIAGVKTDIAQFKKDRIQEARIKAKYDPATAFAIGSDENLKAMENAIAAQQSRISGLIAKGADRAQVMAAQNELTKMVTDFDERLNQLKNTIGFMQDMFDKGFSNAMESFDVQETALNIQFKLDTKSKDSLIKEAQDQIAAIQYKVDDKEAALKSIEDQEQKINDKYDERIKALDEVEKANAAISNQQKGQLTLAEALTSGDIAAAARAAQDMRAQQAADAVTKQKDAVEQSRQYELMGATGLDKTDGKLKTRKQLEQEIKDLQDEVFKIEEDKIEPAQEFIRLRQIQLDKDIEGITVLGRTRDAWEAIKNQVDLALVKSAAFVDSMGLAISTQAKLIAAYAAETGGTQGAFLNPAAFVPAVPVPGETAEQKAAREAKDAAAKAAADKAAADAKAAASSAQNSGNGADAKYDQKPAVAAARADILKATAPTIQAMQKAGNTNAAEAATVTLMKNLAAVAPAIPLTSAQIIAARKQSLGYLSSGGMVPKYFAAGGFARGADTVPAMLTPGEFIMSKYAVDSYGVDNLRKINSGDVTSGAVYNNTYTLTVNAKTDANPNEIAQAVMSTIKQVDDRRVRGVVLNGR